MQAESTLISAAGVLELNTKNLERQRNLFKQSAGAQKDYEQSISDQQAAEAAYRAARGAVMVFGKTDAEMDRIVKERKVDATLTVSSPITGLVTARNAAPGLYVQPGNPPPVYIVADTSVMWMVANVPERQAADLALGQEVLARVTPYPGRTYSGKIVTIGPNIDPNTRRVFVRSEIADPDYDLRAGMFRDLRHYARAAEKGARSSSGCGDPRRRWKHDRVDNERRPYISSARDQDRFVK